MLEAMASGDQSTPSRPPGWVSQFTPDRVVLRALAVIIGLGTGIAVGAALKGVTDGYVIDGVIAGFVSARGGGGAGVMRTRQ
jgi:hypothetical protein